MTFKINNISIKINHIYIDEFFQIYSNKQTTLKKSKQKKIKKTIKHFRHLNILPFSNISVTSFKK